MEEADYRGGSDNVHVGGDGAGGVASREAAHRHHYVVERTDAQSTKIPGHAARKEAALLQFLEVLEWESAFTVMLCGAQREIRRMLFGKHNKVPAFFSCRKQFEAQRAPSSKNLVNPLDEFDVAWDTEVRDV